MQINNRSSPCECSVAKCIFYTLELNIEETFEAIDKSVNYLLFTIIGEMQIKSNLFKTTILHSNETIFIPCSNILECTAKSNVLLLVHIFTNSPYLSDFCIANNYNYPKRQSFQTNQFFILSSSPIVKNFVSNILFYIKENQRKTLETCIWYLKHKELIQLFRYSYHYSELHFFFYSLERYELPFREKVIQYYLKAYNAKELASLCGYGLSTFQRLFYKEFGKTVYRWMLEQKASHILYMLQHSDISFKEIIHEYNFSSHAHFCRFCLNYLKNTPTNLRKTTKRNDFGKNC